MPDDTEEELAKCISWVTRDPARDAFVQKLNKELMNEQGSGDAPADQGANGTQPGSDTDNAPASEASSDTVKRPRAVK